MHAASSWALCHMVSHYNEVIVDFKKTEFVQTQHSDALQDIAKRQSMGVKLFKQSVLDILKSQASEILNIPVFSEE